MSFNRDVERDRARVKAAPLGAFESGQQRFTPEHLAPSLLDGKAAPTRIRTTVA